VLAIKIQGLGDQATGYRAGVAELIVTAQSAFPDGGLPPAIAPQRLWEWKGNGTVPSPANASFETGSRKIADRREFRCRWITCPTPD